VLAFQRRHSPSTSFICVFPSLQEQKVVVDICPVGCLGASCCYKFLFWGHSQFLLAKVKFYNGVDSELTCGALCWCHSRFPKQHERFGERNHFIHRSRLVGVCDVWADAIVPRIGRNSAAMCVVLTGDWSVGGVRRTAYNHIKRVVLKFRDVYLFASRGGYDVLQSACLYFC